MFCLRRSVTTFSWIHAFSILHEIKQANMIDSWLPLLFIPTNAAPIYVALFFVCTYFLNRPCVYCSFLLLILFASSCNWSDHCFFDFSKNWFEPTSSTYLAVDNASNATVAVTAIKQALEFGTTVNETGKALGAIAIQEAQKAMCARPEWTGIGVGWLRSLLGRREWTLPCVDVKIRL